MRCSIVCVGLGCPLARRDIGTRELIGKRYDWLLLAPTFFLHYENLRKWITLVEAQIEDGNDGHQSCSKFSEKRFSV